MGSSIESKKSSIESKKASIESKKASIESKKVAGIGGINDKKFGTFPIH